jgi:hypothetical protein
MIITAEGTWTFGVTARASVDYPVLLNNSAANGGWAASLQGRLCMVRRQRQTSHGDFSGIPLETNHGRLDPTRGIWPTC